MLDEQRQKIAWLIRAPLRAVSAHNAVLEKSLRDTGTRRIYLWLHPDELGGPMPQVGVIISKLRAIYGPIGGRFSVLSEKRGRHVISAWWCNEITKSESQPS